VHMCSSCKTARVDLQLVSAGLAAVTLLLLQAALATHLCCQCLSASCC
jgi:hypothetical protein